MKIEWSVYALSDREQIFDYIEADDPRSAISVDERVEQQVESLADFPLMGRLGRTEGTRELVIVGTSYIVVYEASERLVRILRVLHGSRRWPDEFFDA